MDKNIFKLKISNYYISDSFEFLNRFETLRDSKKLKKPSVGKLAIELLFSLECSLKALIFIEDKNDVEKIYEKVKTHNFDKLINKMKKESSEKLKYIFEEENFKNWNVNIRYYLEAECFLANSYRKKEQTENFKYGVSDLLIFDSIEKLNKIEKKIKQWLMYVVEVYNKDESIVRFKSESIHNKLTQISKEKIELQNLTGKTKK